MSYLFLGGEDNSGKKKRKLKKGLGMTGLKRALTNMLNAWGTDTNNV